MPEISVIVPVYKVEPYLRRCVDSILGQTFTDFEVILVDDGSPDACPAICDEYAGKDERVRVIHQENGGLSAARNAGLDWVFSNSDSRWISFVDSDDWVHPRFLEYLHRAAVENNVQISICTYKKMSEFKPDDSDIVYEATLKTSYQVYEYLENGLIFTLAWNKLYSKNLFCGQRYPVGKISEDTFVTYKLLYKCNYIAYIEHPLYFYYVNQDSITNSTYSVARQAELEALKIQLHFFLTHHEESWAKVCTIRTVRAYAFHILNYCTKFPELFSNCKMLQKELRHFLCKYRNLYNFSFSNNKWIYEAAYPKLMAWYWRIQAVKNLVHKYGVFAVIGRIFQKIGAKLTNDT